MEQFRFFGPESVDDLLDYPGTIAAVRTAMLALSADGREQPLRSITPLGEGSLFGIMPGMLSGTTAFGAKLASVYPDPVRPSRARHQGIIALFDGSTGAISCLADAESVTRIRTACASAVATDALAASDVRTLGVFGCGMQARAHVAALTQVRAFEKIGLWGRDRRSADILAADLKLSCEQPIFVFDDPSALAGWSDVICTVTSAQEPFLKADWVRPGAHVNVVGSSYAGPREVDDQLVAGSRFFVDYRASALAAAAEFLSAQAAGLVGQDHILGEIGQVLRGEVAARLHDRDITLYKSLGHIVQDLAAVAYLSRSEGT